MSVKSPGGGAGGGSGGTPAFSAITSGTNTTAAMVVGTGASLAATGTGTITATNGVPAGGTAGQYLAKNSSTDFDDGWYGPPLTAVSSPQIAVDTTDYGAGNVGFNLVNPQPTEITITPTQASNTEADGLILADTTAATASNQQYSPSVRFTGQGWSTTGPASIPLDWRITLVPLQAAAATSNLVFETQQNGGGFGTRVTFANSSATFTGMTVSAAGLVPTSASSLGVGITLPATNSLGFWSGSALRGEWDANGNFTGTIGSHATTDTNGFIYVGAVAGVPTGVPAALTGNYANNVPLVYDSTDNKLYAYDGGWQDVAATDINLLQVKPTATVATTAALPTNTYNNGASGVGATLTAIVVGTLTIDGHVVALGDLVLVKNEVASANNGLYVATVAGAAGAAYILTRQSDMNQAAEFSGAIVPVSNVGTANANSLWLANPSGTVTVGTTVIPFTQLNGATDLTQGTGITISGNTISITTNGVTNALLAQMATNTIKGNNTGGTANAADLTVAQIQALLTPTSGVWSARGSGSYTGQLYRATDIGPANVGTTFVWDNTASVWKLTAPAHIVFNTTLSTAAALNTSEQIVMQNTIPAGLLSAGRLFVIRVVWARDGLTDATTITLRMGSAGTTSDTQLFTFATFLTGGSTRQGASETWLYPTTTTNLVLAESVSSQSFSSNNSSSASATPVNYTVADYTANALIISADTTQAGSTNHGQVARMFVELYP
jgi:hypothetical protein